MGTQLPLPKWGQRPPIFGPCLLWPMAGWIKMASAWKLGLGPGHIVLDRDPAPPPEKEHSPHFLTHVYCGETAGWIKMPLATKVGRGPGHIVLHMEIRRSPKGTQSPPIFGACLLWPNGRPSQLLLSTCIVLQRTAFSTSAHAFLIGRKQSLLLGMR